MKRALTALAVTLLLSPLASLAQDRPMMPKGRWWKMPEVAKRLALTAEQQTKLDAVFTERSKELIDLKAGMEKAAIELRASLEHFDSKPADVLKNSAALGDARAKLFTKEIEMMLDMRAELNEEQWSQLRSALEQHMENRMDGRRPMQRPGQGTPPRP